MSKVFRAGLASALLLLSGAVATSGTAQANSTSEIQAIIADRLESDPGGLVVGNKIIYPGDTVVTAIEAGVYSISDCSANRFCLWNNNNYTGTITQKSGTAVTYNLSGSFRSAWNNRSSIARLYNSSGSSYTCIAPNGTRTGLSGSYLNPAKVYLASATSC